MNISPQIEQILAILQHQLSGSLIAVYLHGSSVSGGLKPTSDIDILVVIEHSINQDQGMQLVQRFMDISGLYPSDPKGRRPLEIAIFSTQELADISYPAKCEFIYGEWLRQDYQQGKYEGQTQDPEFTLMLAQAQQEAINLWQIKRHKLPVIDKQQIKQAMLDCLPNLLLSLQGDERNVLLTLVRMWKTMTSGEFVSKEHAADWAIDLMPKEPTLALIHARDAYLNGELVDWGEWRNELQCTTNYIEQQIKDAFYQN